LKDQLVIIGLAALVLLAPFSHVNGQEPLYGGTLRVGFATSKEMFNPTLHYSGVSGLFHRDIFNGLLSWTIDYDIEGDLAKSWETRDGGKTFVFHLFQGVKWHDGKPFTSADVKWHYEMLKELGKTTPTPLGPYVKDIESIEVPNEYTVIFKCGSVHQLSDWVGGYGDNLILPKHLFEGTDMRTNPYNLKPIGTGPFKYVSHQGTEYLRLQANLGYFRGRPYLDEVVYRFYAKPETGLIALEAGEIDAISQTLGIPFPEIPRIKQHEKITVEGFGYDTVIRVYFNFREEAWKKNPWLADINVRKAIAHAIGKNTILEKVLYGITTTTWGPFSNRLKWAYPPELFEMEPKYEVKLAEKLLDDAGYPRKADGFRFKAKLTVIGSQALLAPVVKDYLVKVGIDVDLEVLEHTTWLATYFFAPEGLKDIPLALAIGGTGPDPAKSGTLYHSKMVPAVGGENCQFYNNPEADKLYDAASSEMDKTKRADLYKKVAVIIAKDYPCVWLFNNYKIEAWNKDFMNFPRRMYAFWKKEGQRDVWWTKGKPLATTAVPITTPVTTTPAVTPTPPAAMPIEIVAAIAVVVVAAAGIALWKRRKPPKT